MKAIMPNARATRKASKYLSQTKKRQLLGCPFPIHDSLFPTPPSPTLIQIPRPAHADDFLRKRGEGFQFVAQAADERT